jgi:hypothetical protein
MFWLCFFFSYYGRLTFGVVLGLDIQDFDVDSGRPVVYVDMAPTKKS